jgi:hypothetical protein
MRHTVHVAALSLFLGKSFVQQVLSYVSDGANVRYPAQI